MMVKKFKGPAELVSWLAENEIDTEPWGTGAYKTVANLWDEYETGDIAFETDSPLRIVRVVQIMVQNNGAILLEKEQVFTNGKRRFRKQPPSEKMKRGETILDAAYRCLEEELGLCRDQIDRLRMGSESEEAIADSPSYPGLPTRYTIQEVCARVRGLPEQDFWKENEAAALGDPVSRHLWGWQRV